MYFSKPIIFTSLYKCTITLNCHVRKQISGQCRKLQKLNNVFPSESSILSLRTLTTNPSQVLESAQNDKDIELSPLSPEMEELAKGDPEIGKKIRVILMEYEMHKLTDRRMPSTLTVENMRELLDRKGYQSRKKFLNFIFLKEILPMVDKEKKEKRRLQRLQEKAQLEIQEQENNHIRYGLNNNTIFPHIRDKTMNRFSNYRQAYALMFGQPIVFDLGFEDTMSKRENLNMIEQLAMAHHENKIHNDPYSMFFTNVSFQSPTYTQLVLTMPQLTAEDYNMITVSDKSYLELFPKEKLVYLSPQAEHTLETYNHDAIYIIGGIVDKGPEIPLTMAKAKREGIRMAKLPLEKYLMWGSGSKKNLALNHILKIMLDIKYTKDWKSALNNVPTRKLKKLEEVREFEMAKQERLRKKVTQLQKREKRIFDQEFWKKF